MEGWGGWRGCLAPALASNGRLVLRRAPPSVHTWAAGRGAQGCRRRARAAAELCRQLASCALLLQVGDKIESAKILAGEENLVLPK